MKTSRAGTVIAVVTAVHPERQHVLAEVMPGHVRPEGLDRAGHLVADLGRSARRVERVDRVHADGANRDRDLAGPRVRKWQSVECEFAVTATPGDPSLGCAAHRSDASRPTM
ncbi:hypothetical protein GCM10027614_69780 [Micromonospora vulcania]